MGFMRQARFPKHRGSVFMRSPDCPSGRQGRRNNLWVARLLDRYVVSLCSTPHDDDGYWLALYNIGQMQVGHILADRNVCPTAWEPLGRPGPAEEDKEDKPAKGEDYNHNCPEEFAHQVQ